MLKFDIEKEPPTSNDIKDAKQSLLCQRRVLVKYSCISDALHAVFFFALYYFDSLSGPAVLAAIGLSTVFALLLATTVPQPLKRSDKLLVALMAIGIFLAVTLLLHVTIKQPLQGSLLAGFGGGSILILGATLGRKIKMVLQGLDDLRPLGDDDYAQEELLYLCSEFAELKGYRQQARDILRPNLTYGELAAMKRWIKGEE